MLSESDINRLAELRTQKPNQRGVSIDPSLGFIFVQSVSKDFSQFSSWKQSIEKHLKPEDTQAAYRFWRKYSSQRDNLRSVAFWGHLTDEPEARGLYVFSEDEVHPEFKISLYSPLDWRKACDNGEITLGNYHEVLPEGILDGFPRVLRTSVVAIRLLLADLIPLKNRRWIPQIVANPSPKGAPPPVFEIDPDFATAYINYSYPRNKLEFETHGVDAVHVRLIAEHIARELQIT